MDIREVDNWQERLPKDFFRSENEKWILKLTLGEIRMKSYDIIRIVKGMTGVTLPMRTIVGLKARLRRALGEDVIPLDKYIKGSHDNYYYHSSEEVRAEKALKKTGLKPLPPKQMSLREAGSEKKRAYIFEYNIVRQMYKNYLCKQETLERYKEARQWFHEKYHE